MACGSHAAASTALTIRRWLQRFPVPARAPGDGKASALAVSPPPRSDIGTVPPTSPDAAERMTG
ncbi:hypothetical protein [Chloroflexus sp.]|uniref:hypothetical protein n=1 Tax=Chloroflexus sp. TaxID=1904827 RepID=UPI002ADDB736|nr:hypothetical protein [Chloroflexus sp.]